MLVPRIDGESGRDHVAIVPRLIRLRDASTYLGLDKNRFNREARQLLPAIPVGTQRTGKACNLSVDKCRVPRN